MRSAWASGLHLRSRTDEKRGAGYEVNTFKQSALIHDGYERPWHATPGLCGTQTKGVMEAFLVSAGVVALAETLAREVRPDGIGVSVLCPMIVETNLLANTERVRSDDYGPAHSEAETVAQLASAPADDSVLDVDDVARLTAEAILANRLYVLPHRASRDSIQRRFARIDRTFDEQAAEGWTH